jgi:hypothetical protein
MLTALIVLLRSIGLICGGPRAVVLENLALRQQLALLTRTVKRPTLRSTDRLFWILLAKGVLTAFRPPGPAGPLVWRRRPLRSGSRGRPSRRAEPCPGSASFSRGHPRRLNDENSRGKVQNVRAHSSDEH